MSNNLAVSVRERSGGISDAREARQPAPLLDFTALRPRPTEKIPAEISAQIEQQLKRAEGFGLSTDSSKQALSDFFKGLYETYGTLPEFLDRVTATRVNLPEIHSQSGKSYVGVQAESPDRAELFERSLDAYYAELAQNGVELKDHSPDLAAQGSDAGFEKRFARGGCGCCQSIAREAQLAGNNDSRKVSSHLPESAHITPNAYPWYYGNYIVSTLSHIAEPDRAPKVPAQSASDKPSFLYTLGKILGDRTPHAWMEEFLQFAVTYDSVAFINHAVSGRSAEDHLHGQLFPKDLIHAELFREEQRSPSVTTDEHSPLVAARSSHHPFDVLVIKSTDMQLMARALTNLRNRCEDLGIVHVMAYSPNAGYSNGGTCFFGVFDSPANELGEKRFQKNDLGARYVLSCYRGEELDPTGWQSKVAAIAPKAGTFNWRELITNAVPELKLDDPLR